MRCHIIAQAAFIGACEKSGQAPAGDQGHCCDQIQKPGSRFRDRLSRRTGALISDHVGKAGYRGALTDRTLGTAKTARAHGKSAHPVRTLGWRARAGCQHARGRRLQIHDRHTLWQLVINPELHCLEQAQRAKMDYLCRKLRLQFVDMAGD